MPQCRFSKGTKTRPTTQPQESNIPTTPLQYSFKVFWKILLVFKDDKRVDDRFRIFSERSIYILDFCVGVDYVGRRGISVTYKNISPRKT